MNKPIFLTILQFAQNLLKFNYKILQCFTGWIIEFREQNISIIKPFIKKTFTNLLPTATPFTLDTTTPTAATSRWSRKGNQTMEAPKRDHINCLYSVNFI